MSIYPYYGLKKLLKKCEIKFRIEENDDSIYYKIIKKGKGDF